MVPYVWSLIQFTVTILCVEGVLREEVAGPAGVAADGRHVCPQLGGVRAARARAVEEPILLDVGPPPHVAFNDKGLDNNSVLKWIEAYVFFTL